MTAYLLRNGQATHDIRLDRMPEFDIRSLDHLAAPLLLPEDLHTPRSFTWYLDSYLDQGAEGACVGFGFAHEAAARPVKVPMSPEFAREAIYWEAQRMDEWSGGSYPGATEVYEGTSVLAGAKVCKRLGLFDSYKWATDIQTFAAAIGFHGPGVIGVEWYEGMFNTDVDGYIRPTGRIMGGHCICVVGVRVVKINPHQPMSWRNVDFVRSYFLLHNSWGPDWGKQGRAKVAFIDMVKLFPGGDFLIPVDRKNLPSPQ